jgi:hypothetical protein
LEIVSQVYLILVEVSSLFCHSPKQCLPTRSFLSAEILSTLSPKIFDPLSLQFG